MSSFLGFDNTPSLPVASSVVDLALIKKRIAESINKAGLTDRYREIGKNSLCESLLTAILTYSPYLSQIISLRPQCYLDACEMGPEDFFALTLENLRQFNMGTATRAEFMRKLRLARQEIALVTAMADIAGLWDVVAVTRHLADFADVAINLTVNHLLCHMVKEKELALPNLENPQIGSGLIVLAMGKLGAYELNYSSDIDLIILFDKENPNYCGKRGVQQSYNHLAQDLVTILQDRTADGYVFRTDLRLRPDPRSMPLAVNLHAAIAYYETLGQNWERAAMIKARAVAGDEDSIQYFEQRMRPYIWRKHLDFESIRDIHSIKRQMTIKVGEAMELAGYNVKLGRGGIREIEFYVQTQQLVWGGRMPELRCKGTLDGLQRLRDAELIKESARRALHDAYLYLRRVEHYLQMIEDRQTHTLPEDEAGLNHIAHFLGHESIAALRGDLFGHATTVHRLYSESMEGAEPLSSEGNLVFTGVEADPDTLRTLEKMGYMQAEAISDIIQYWHRGSRRATRSKRAREILTELIPHLLKSLASSPNPDAAFFRFDKFISNMPAGVQIFSLLTVKPELMDLLANVLGSAPALADQLSKNPLLLESVLDGEFYAPLPTRDELSAELQLKIDYAQFQEEALLAIRRFKNEKQFQAGVQMLKGQIDSSVSGMYLTQLAEVITEQLVQFVTHEFVSKHGHLPNSALAVLALGKLGSGELTFNSDLDLILLYHAGDMNVHSDGEKALDARSYYNRLCSRIITAITMPSQEGVLYDVDTRLRPGGKDSPIATHFEGMERYYSGAAWVFEYMALTRARVVYAENSIFADRIDAMISNQLSHLHLQPNTDLTQEVISMREKIAQQFPTQNPWNIKYVRGGLIDVDFIAQTLELKYAAGHPEMIQPNSSLIFKAAKDLGLLEEHLANQLAGAHAFYTALLSFLRLCSDGEINDNTAPSGLKHLLTERFKRRDFKTLREDLLQSQAFILEQFNRLADL